MSSEGVSVIIPSYNGRGLLESNLPALVEALASSSIETEVIVVDDGSNDDTPELLAGKYPQVACLALAENVGFGRAVMEGIARARYRLAYLMNNDIVATGGFLEPLVAHFDDPEVFAVGSQALNPNGRSIFSRMGIAFEQGRLKIRRNDDSGALTEPAPTLFASAGHGMFDKDKLLTLGGFDSLYYPFYMEDADLCWRAWAAGWRVVYEPSSVVIHDHQSTIGVMWSRGAVERIHRRNEWLFNWKNLSDRGFFLRHLLAVPVLVFLGPLTGRTNLTLSFFQALGRLGPLKESRRRARASRRLSEREIIDRVMESFQKSSGSSR